MHLNLIASLICRQPTTSGSHIPGSASAAVCLSGLDPIPSRSSLHCFAYGCNLGLIYWRRRCILHKIMRVTVNSNRIICISAEAFNIMQSTSRVGSSSEAPPTLSLILARVSRAEINKAHAIVGADAGLMVV